MAKQKFYVVWVGKQPGIYTSWPECQKQVQQVKDAKYKSFPTRAEAEKAFAEGWKAHWGKGASAGTSGANSARKSSGSTRQQSLFAIEEEEQEPDLDSISVDVGCSGNPGIVEYKGVDTKTGELLFYHGPIDKGTNNLGEFIAIVHGLAYLKKLGSNKTVYTDSKTALKWLKQKKVASTLVRDETTEEIWSLTDRAIKWLKENDYDNKVLKWQTERWGEIKADFGRK